MILKGVMNSHLPDLEAEMERDGLQKSSSCTIKTSFPTQETSQCGTPEEIAWSFGSLIGHIFHQDGDSSDPNLSCLNSIPPTLQFIYKRCLAKNPLKRPSIQVLRDLLSSVQEFNKLSVMMANTGGDPLGNSSLSMVNAAPVKWWIDSTRTWSLLWRRWRTC